MRSKPCATCSDACRSSASASATNCSPRPPTAWAGARVRDVQAPVRPPRSEPPRTRHEVRPRPRDGAEPWLRGAHRREHQSCVAERRNVRRPFRRRLRERPVPSRGCARPARRTPVLRRGCSGMPRREDLRSVLIVGSGPIRIGQGCEFDYSASQACRVLRREGLRVVLVNSNPATIMTDPEWADATYIEPLDLETVTEVIEAERPDALLPTLGGQTALNLAIELHEAGVLAVYGVELLGASVEAIRRAEDRLLFRDAMIAAGLRVPRSGGVNDPKGPPSTLRA